MRYKRLLGSWIWAMLLVVVMTGPIVAADADVPGPGPSASPTPVTSAGADDQAVALFGPANALVQRYPSRLPPVVHVQLSDGDGKWTIYNDGKTILMKSGHAGKPYITFTCSHEELHCVAKLASSLTIANKVELAKLVNGLGEKPMEPPAGGKVLPQPKVTDVEKRLLRLGELSAKIRWLFHKVEVSPGQVAKIFWGLQIRVLAMYIDMFRTNLLERIWTEIDGDLDRGQIEITPGKNFELLVNVVTMYALYKDDDRPAYGVALRWLTQRLNSELQGIGDYPPAVGAIRKQAIEKRLGVVTALAELL